MSTTTGWVIGLLILIVLGGGAYWAYSSRAGSGDAMMHQDAAMTGGSVMTQTDAMASSSDAGMASSSGAMTNH